MKSTLQYQTNIFMHMSGLRKSEVELGEKNSAVMDPKSGKEGAGRRKTIFMTHRIGNSGSLRRMRHSRAAPGLHRTTEKFIRPALERSGKGKELLKFREARTDISRLAGLAAFFHAGVDPGVETANRPREGAL